MNFIIIAELLLVLLMLVVITREINNFKKYFTLYDCDGELEITTPIAFREITEAKPPWYSLRFEIEKFFEGDPDITVDDLIDETEDIRTIFIRVHSYQKYLAMKKLITEEYPMGNIMVKIDIQCDVNENDQQKDSKITIDTFDTLFTNNKFYDKTEEKELPWPWKGTKFFVVMKKEIVQFPTDDISDLWGNDNMTAEDVFRDILNPDISNICVCTAVTE